MSHRALRVALALLLAALPIAAQSGLGTQGIRTVQVEISISFLDTAMLRTTMELELRRAGLRVVAPRSGELVDGSLEFSATMDGMAGDGDPYHAVMARLSLWRKVYLHPSRDAAGVIAVVWQEEFITSDNQEGLREAIRTQLDKLMNEWLAANPHLAARTP